MGFVIDNREWLPQTTGEHAKAWMEGINALLEANDIRDDKGNIIKLSQNFASALYLQVLAGANSQIMTKNYNKPLTRLISNCAMTSKLKTYYQLHLLRVTLAATQHLC